MRYPGNLQEDVPADNSLVSLMLRTTNKETGRGLTDKQIVAQTNTFLAAGEPPSVKAGPAKEPTLGQLNAWP